MTNNTTDSFHSSSRLLRVFPPLNGTIRAPYGEYKNGLERRYKKEKLSKKEA